MLNESEPFSHRGRVYAVTASLLELREQAGRAACELGEDGAQPHLVAALSAVEAALTVEADRLRVRSSTSDEPEQLTQQALAL